MGYINCPIFNSSRSIINFLHDYNCPICQEWICRPVTIPCGHNFCQDCIEEHRKNQTDEGFRFECAVCRSKYGRNFRFGINLGLQELIKKIGGSIYERNIERREKFVQQSKLLDKYRKSTHFSNAYEIIDCFIDSKPEITFDEIVNHLSEIYDYLLIRFIVGDRINKGGLYVCGNNIIQKDKLNIYISRNIDKLNSDEVLSLMSSEINGPSRGLIMSKFKHQSRTEKKIRKIGRENMNKLCELIKGYLDEEKKEKEKENKKKSKKREKCPAKYL